MHNLINISIDDISPHPKSSLECLSICDYIINNHYKDIKFTLYIPMAYWRRFDDTVEGKSISAKTDSPLYLDEYPEVYNALLNLPEENFELCYHGLYHSDNVCNNNEFEKLNYEEATLKFKKIFDIAKKCNLYNKMKMTFRPPNFRMSPDAIRAAYDVGFRQLSLLPDDKVKVKYEKAYEVFDKNGCSWVNVMYPFRDYNLYKKTSIVFHACNWNKNYLDLKNSKILIDFLNLNTNIEFCFADKVTDSKPYSSRFLYSSSYKLYREEAEREEQ